MAACTYNSTLEDRCARLDNHGLVHLCFWVHKAATVGPSRRGSQRHAGAGPSITKRAAPPGQGLTEDAAVCSRERARPHLAPILARRRRDTAACVTVSRPSSSKLTWKSCGTLVASSRGSKRHPPGPCTGRGSVEARTQRPTVHSWRAAWIAVDSTGSGPPAGKLQATRKKGATAWGLPKDADPQRAQVVARGGGSQSLVFGAVGTIREPHMRSTICARMPWSITCVDGCSRGPPDRLAATARATIITRGATGPCREARGWPASPGPADTPAVSAAARAGGTPRHARRIPLPPSRQYAWPTTYPPPRGMDGWIARWHGWMDGWMDRDGDLDLHENGRPKTLGRPRGGR
eukprot:scaffold7395_cov417-Prasinococcus_capsulatus_cf.AAC.1